MPSKYMTDGSELGSLIFIFLFFGAMWLIGKALAFLNILTTKNSTTLAKIFGVGGGLVYSFYILSVTPVKNPTWWMFIAGLIAGAALGGILIFAVAWVAFSLAAKEDKSK